MKKYSRVLAGILAVLLSAGCTGLYAAAQSDSSSAADSTASTTKSESDKKDTKKIQKIQRKLISLTVIQKSRLRKKQFMLSLTLPATRQKQSFPTG